MLFMQVLTDCPVRTYLFRLEFDTLEEAICVAEQEDFSVKQDDVSSNSYRFPRRQENGGPEPMDLCTLRVKAPAVPIIRSCRDSIDVKRQGIMRTNAVPRTRYHVPQETLTVQRPRKVQGVGLNAV